jgi:threonine dehydrogenase-like Zn-dependent dehydrogenase
MGQFPLIPGHEFAGTVVEVGREVTDLVVGERVAVDPNLPCGHCVFCRGQQANHCLHWQGVGVTCGGGFAEYVSAPARACYRLPSELSDGAERRLWNRWRAWCTRCNAYACIPPMMC